MAHSSFENYNLKMDTVEFGTEQVKKEIVYNDFNEDFPTDTVKQEPSKINILSKCGMYDDSRTETDFVDKPEYINFEFCKDMSTDECKKEQIKCDNDLDIFYEDIKREVVEENFCELDRFCEICNNSISSETGFDSKNNKFECSCQKQNDSINLQSKEITMDSGLQQLIVQGKTVSGYGCSNVHERIKTGEKLFRCKICPRSFSSSKYLKNHENIHAEEKSFHCNVCSKSFFHSKNLDVHMTIHTGEQPFHCNICSKSFRLSRYLKNHKRLHAEEKPFHCNFCSKSFRLSKYLKEHKKLHAEEKPFHCKVCSKSFFHSRSLNSHIKVHTEKKPCCKVCSRPFLSANGLRVHMKSHTGEKPFHCKICSKSFSLNGDLHIHLKSHTTENPFQCKICSKYFDGESYFNTHIKMHTEFQL